MKNNYLEKTTSLSSIFLKSALFFTFFSFFGVYKYTIYSIPWFIMFFVYEIVFYTSLRSGNLMWRRKGNYNKQDSDNHTSFELTKNGATIILIAAILSFFCFAYFVYLYRGTIGAFAFKTYGAFTAGSFEEGRTAFEKITLFFMHMGSEAAFLVCSADKTKNYKKLKALTHITLFLPGLRYILMGSRFSIAVEFLLLFVVKWPELRARINFSARAKREKRFIIIVAIVLGIAFLYLFSSRSIYYTALDRKAFNVGDMQMKPIWENIYNSTDGRIDFICTASDYLGEAPYIFSYFCKYRMPEKIYCGQFTFRSILQIINNLLHIGKSYSQITNEIASGQYSGMAWILIVDFGVIGSLICTIIFGHLFAKIEKNRKRSRICAVILPAIKVMCFFAPIFYFYVGRLDYILIFSVLLASICLKRERDNYIE